jgi:hypothetical protein
MSRALDEALDRLTRACLDFSQAATSHFAERSNKRTDAPTPFIGLPPHTSDHPETSSTRLPAPRLGDPPIATVTTDEVDAKSLEWLSSKTGGTVRTPIDPLQGFDPRPPVRKTPSQESSTKATSTWRIIISAATRFFHRHTPW